MFNAVSSAANRAGRSSYSRNRHSSFAAWPPTPAFATQSTTGHGSRSSAILSAKPNTTPFAGASSATQVRSLAPCSGTQTCYRLPCPAEDHGLISSRCAGQRGDPQPPGRCGLAQPRCSSDSWLEAPFRCSSQHTPGITAGAGDGCSAPLRSPEKPRSGKVRGCGVPPASAGPNRPPRRPVAGCSPAGHRSPPVEAVGFGWALRRDWRAAWSALLPHRRRSPGLRVGLRPSLQPGSSPGNTPRPTRRAISLTLPITGGYDAGRACRKSSNRRQDKRMSRSGRCFAKRATIPQGCEVLVSKKGSCLPSSLRGQ